MDNPNRDLKNCKTEPESENDKPKWNLENGQTEPENENDKPKWDLKNGETEPESEKSTPPNRNEEKKERCQHKFWSPEAHRTMSTSHDEDTLDSRTTHYLN